MSNVLDKEEFKVASEEEINQYISNVLIVKTDRTPNRIYARQYIAGYQKRPLRTIQGVGREIGNRRLLSEEKLIPCYLYSDEDA